MDLEKTLEQCAFTLRPWIGVMDASRHLWDSSRKEIDSFLQAADKLYVARETYKVEKYNTRTQKAEDLMQSTIVRLEEELWHLFRKHSKQLDPKKVIETSSAKTKDGNYVSKPSNFVIIPENLGPSFTEIITRLIKFGSSTSVKSIFKAERKKAVDGIMSSLQLNSMSPEKLLTLSWDELEGQIDSWLLCFLAAIRVVFPSEKFLCDFVIYIPELAEECFLETVKSTLESLFVFSEAIASGKRTPEKLFRVLEMFETFRDLQKLFETTFSGAKCEALRKEYKMSRLRLSEASRGIFVEFENAIERDATKAPVAGGEVHGLTRYVVNYLILLYDYRKTLTQLFTSPDGSVSEDLVIAASMGDDIDEEEKNRQENSPLSASIRWKLAVLLRNLQEKGKLYRDPALGHFFLMNNVHYMASKVKNSDLRSLLGDDWIREQAEIVRKHANEYQRKTWDSLLKGIREDPVAGTEAGSISRGALKERFRTCNEHLENIHRTQVKWFVPDSHLCDELKAAIMERVLSSYSAFHSRYAKVLEAGKHPAKYIKYTPANVQAMIMDLFKGA